MAHRPMAKNVKEYSMDYHPHKRYGINKYAKKYRLSRRKLRKEGEEGTQGRAIR